MEFSPRTIREHSKLYLTVFHITPPYTPWTHCLHLCIRTSGLTARNTYRISDPEQTRYPFLHFSLKQPWLLHFHLHHFCFLFTHKCSCVSRNSESCSGLTVSPPWSLALLSWKLGSPQSTVPSPIHERCILVFVSIGLVVGWVGCSRQVHAVNQSFCYFITRPIRSDVKDRWCVNWRPAV